MSDFSKLIIQGYTQASNLNASLCLEADEFMDYNHPAVREAAEKLTTPTQTTWDKAEAIFNFIRDEIVYDFAPNITGPENWMASVILGEKRGFCHQKSILQCALYRAVKIPAALTFQNLIDFPLMETRYKERIKEGILPYHGLALVYLEDKWYRQDATLDSGLCKRRGYRVTVVKKGEETLLPETTLSGKPHFKIHKEHGYFHSFDPRFRDSLLSDFSAWKEWQSFVKKEHLSM